MIGFHFFTLILVSHSPCLAISTDKVLAKNLAEREPEFAALEPDLPFTFAPLPGIQRVLSRRELGAFLLRNGAKSSDFLQDLCIERETARIKEADLATAIRSAVKLADVHVQILDYSHQPMPPGVLQFKAETVSLHALRPFDGPIIWPGRLLYDGRRSAAIWVRAMVWVERELVVADTDIRAGELVTSENVQLERVHEFPLENNFARSLEDVLGFKSRIMIRKGCPLSLAQLDRPWTIFKGDKVLVRVIAGLTHLTLEAIAISSGHSGDEVTLRNPETGRTFRAVVEAKGTAVLHQRDTL